LFLCFLGSLVFAGRSLLLPFGTLSLVFDTLPGFGDPCRVGFTSFQPFFGAFKFTVGAFATGAGLGLELFDSLSLLIGSLLFGVCASTFCFGASVQLRDGLAFGSEFLLERSQSRGTQEEGFLRRIEPP
jgi:hypothetical protein